MNPHQWTHDRDCRASFNNSELHKLGFCHEWKGENEQGWNQSLVVKLWFVVPEERLNGGRAKLTFWFGQRVVTRNERTELTYWSDEVSVCGERQRNQQFDCLVAILKKGGWKWL